MYLEDLLNSIEQIFVDCELCRGAPYGSGLCIMHMCRVEHLSELTIMESNKFESMCHFT